MKVPNFKENKGITLAALVITIIVLLIIATITVTTLSGNNGIVEQTVTDKEESEIKSELKVVDLASNQAKNKNKYGDVTGEELVKALKNNAGEDQTEVEYYEKGSLYFVTFKKSNRVYEVTTAGYAKYVGKPEDAVVLFGKPKSSIAPKTSVEVNVIIKTLQENKIDKLEYVWNKSEDKQPSKEEFSNNTPKVLENVENEKTEKQTTLSLPEGTPEGEYYLWVKVTNNGEETIEHLGPYIIGEVSCQLAVDPNGGTWDGSSEVKVIKQSVGNKIDLKTPNPPANYEITFDADGGNVSKDKVTSVVSFNRWELKGVGTLEKNIYTFGKGKATATAQYSNEKITLPTATKDGYQIDGWYDKDGNKAGDPNEEYDPKGSEKLTAHWTPKSYELAFDYKTNGGTKGPDETQQVVYGKKVILSEIKAEKDGGWNFIGWNKKASDKTALDEITMGAQNEKVYALFKKDIKLTFKDKNGDKYSNPNPVTIYNNEKGTATAPEISEYTGWTPLYWTKEAKADGAKSVGAKTGDNSISNITDPATYYARYKKDIKIEFDLNGGKGTKPENAPGEVNVSTSDITKPKPATIKMPKIDSGKEPKKDGYVFNGWNTAEDGKGTHYDIDETGSFVDSTTLYAEWTEKKATKLTLNKETATISYDDTTTIIATLEPADLVNKNVNWTTSDANICNISKATSVSGEEITLTAKKVGKATITATAADGSGKTATCVVTVVAKKITVPTAKTNLVYNAANQTGVEQTTEYNVTDGTKIDAGSYTAKVVLKDKTNTMWNDETTTDKTVNWSIAKKDITVEWKEQTSWVYDGTAHKPEVTTPINGAGQEKINLIVEGEKVNVGTDYTATAKISSVDGGQKDKDNYNLTDYTKKFSIREAVIIGKVTINGTNTYGETLTAEVSELDPSDATLKYQWFSNNTNSTTGGTKLTEPQDSKTYTIGKGLVGKYIYVVVTATKPNFNSATFNDITDKEKNTTEKVSAKKITAPTAKTGLVYNGQEQIGVEDGSGYTVKDGTKKDAGNYTAKVELDDKENTIWNDGTTDDKSMPWSIAKKAITVKADNKTKAYGENVPELTATFGETGVQGETLKTSGQLKTTAEKTSNVGTYPITQGTLQLTDNGSFKASNYTINYTEGTLTITKIDNTLVVKAKTLTYNTQEQELVNQTGLQGDIYYSTDVELTKDNYLKEGTKNTIPKGTNAGNYKVYYYAPGNENYNAKSDSVDVTIAQYSLKDAIIETVGSQIYTGSAITPKPEVKVNIPSEQNKTKLVEGRDFEYSYKDNTAVGTATITITGKGNYKDSKPITFNIENKKQIKVSKTDYTGKYDGKSHTFTFNVTEPTSGYNVYYKVGTTPLNENNYTDGTTEEKPTRKDAGTTIVQWYIHTTNAQYADTNGSIEITINPKSIDVKADDKTKKYGEENPTLTATAGETGITGETAKIAGALKTTATKTSNVGTYVIGNDNVELKDNGTFKASNYEMNFINGTLTITKADNTLKVNAKTLTYNTSAQELVNEEGKQGDVYYSIGTELTSDNYNTAGRTTIPTGTNAGDYKVYYYTPGNDNYGLSKGSVNVTIEKYDLKNANMIQGALDYTGSKLTPKPEVTVNIPSEQNKTKLTAGTEFTYSYGANTNAGTNAGSVTITAKDNTNYTGSKTVNFTIAKAANPIAVTTPQEWSEAFATSEKTKGIKAATNAQGTVTYKIQSQVDKDGKAVEYFTLSGTTLTRKANTPVNKSKYTVVIRATAAGNGNYESGYKDITVNVTVTKANGSGSVTMEGWTYGGTAKNPVPTSSTNGTSNVTYKYKVSTAADSTYTETKPSSAGTYTVQATFAATSDYNAVTATANFTIAKKKLSKPTVSVSTAGIVTWGNVADATGYEISLSASSGFTTATSGINYLSNIIASTGSRTVYVRAINSDTTNYTTSDNGTKAVTVYKVTFASNNTNYGTLDTDSYNVISGATVAIDEDDHEKLLINGITTGTETTVLKEINATDITGYHLTGWSKTSGSITATTTITATFAVNTYTIAFNKNNSNASGTMANMSMTYGTAKTLTANAFAVTTAGITSKQVFNGWNTKADGSGTSYSNGQSVNNLTTTNGGTVTLYAQWINANYSVSSPVKYTTTLAQAVSAANTSATITVLQTNTDSSSVSIGKTLTLALNGKTLTRTAWMFLTAGTFTISGSGLLTTPSDNEYGIIQGTGGTLATSGSPTIISTSNMIIGNDMDLNLQGGTLITTMRSVITIYNWSNATIKNTNILCVPRNKNSLLAYNKNGKNLTIENSIVANGSGAPVVDTTDTTATTIHFASTGTLYITGSSKIVSGPNNESTICTPDATLHGVKYSGKGSKINISGSTSIFAYERCLNVNCSKITINTTGYLAAAGDYAVYNQDQTANIDGITKGVFISRNSSHYTIYNNGTKSGLSSEASPGKTRTYTYYTRNGNSITSATYSRNNTYVYRKGQ